MAFTRYASFEQAQVLDLKGTASRSHVATLDKVADFENYRTGDGYLYARIRAISSRVNRNHDGWPSIELSGKPELFEHHHGASGFTVEASDGNPEYGFATFIGKPIFVDHHNSNPKKARGAIVDSKLNVLDKTATAHDSYWGGHDVDHEHMPATEVELLLEIDAKSFPRLAEAIVSGDLDGFSMGCDVDKSKCSHCGHIATNPDEYCSHIVMKGAHHDFKTADGKRIARKSYENCYGIKFFEISAVFEPADETAKAREVRAAVYKEADLVPGPPPGPGSKPDPARPHDADVADLAMAYQMKGIDPDSAMSMAQQQIEKEHGVPGHGEGFSAEGYPKQWMYDKLPEGMPPPQRQGVPASPFGQDAEAALNEAHPRRPIVNDWRNSHVHTAENPLPQEMMVRAPDELDTLRDEQLCPICGNDMSEETCQVCGYVQPPKEFDNPDLDKAKQIREEMKQQEEQQANPQSDPSSTAPPEAGGGNSPSGPPSGMPSNPTKVPATAKVKSDMPNWTPKVHPKTAARINQVERPINTSNKPVSDEPKNEVVTKDQKAPVTAAMQTARQLMANAKRNHTGESMSTRTADGPTPPGDTSPKTRVDTTGVGGVDEASNEAASKADAQVDVTGIGTTGVSDVAADKTETLQSAGRDSDDSGFNTDKTTEDSGPTKTFGDKDGEHSGVSDPVTNEPFPASADGVKSAHQRQAYDDNTLEQNEQQGNKPVAQGGSAVQGVQPIDPVATDSYKRVNVLEHTTSPANNSGPTTTWNGTDGNGVLQQQEPITQNSQEWGGVSVPDVKLHTGRVSLGALRLAEAEVELGLIAAKDKFNRIVEADAMDPREVQAQLETLSRVKTAGLAKLAAHRQSGATRLPKAFGKQTAAPDGFERIAAGAEVQERQVVSDDVLDAGLFIK